MSPRTAVIDVGALLQHADRLARTLPADSDPGTEEHRVAIEAALDETIDQIVTIVD